ncbi:hypothetical protein EVAR_38090_1 [Eumeta japonica]|uniref:Uncharacterized protein n=1 Tax=Eumeta variegata TaxID=151549 RepID=A0A4C1WB07_EUMVA|nr:hypothetical protein EVAR_38090_1 [Eumeta japonica]
MVQVMDSCGQFRNVRALLDTGSQSTFISESCARRSADSRYDGYRFDEDYRQSSKLFSSSGAQNEFRGLNLADERFYESRSVELLIGADLLCEIICGGIIRFSPDLPCAVNTIFGHVLMGSVVGRTEAEAKQLMLDLTKLLSSAGFELRKWTSNNAELLSDIPRDHLEPHVFDNADGISYIKILGIQWNSSTDRFTYHLNLPKDSNCTKRTILSALARTYDPLGWIAPVILQGKLLMQRLWALGIDWDVDPPQEIVKHGIAYYRI